MISANVAGEACARSRITPSRTSSSTSARPEPREPAVLGGAVGEGVAAVPRQPRHAHAELPERLGGPHLVAELLDALEREHQPDPLAALDRVEVGCRPNLHNPLGILADGTEQAGRLAERLAERALGLALELDEDRAHLQPDAAGLEQGQPRPGERARLAEAQLAVAELEQQVEVGVRDHAGSLRASASAPVRAPRIARCAWPPVVDIRDSGVTFVRWPYKTRRWVCWSRRRHVTFHGLEA